MLRYHYYRKRSPAQSSHANIHMRGRIPQKKSAQTLLAPSFPPTHHYRKKSNKMEIKGPHINITASFCECSPKSVLLLTAPQSASILSCVLTSVSIHYSNKIPYTKPTSKPYQVQNACILTY